MAIINRQIPATANLSAPMVLGVLPMGANAWDVPVVPQSTAALRISIIPLRSEEISFGGLFILRILNFQQIVFFAKVGFLDFGRIEQFFGFSGKNDVSAQST